MAGLKGSTVPRVYTDPLRDLTRETSLGFDIIDFARHVLEVDLIPWEEWFLVHAFEIVGDFDGEWHFRFRTVVAIIGRQNGKTFLSKIIALYFLYVLCVGLIIGTAQDLSQAEDTWNEALETAQSIPELDREIMHVYRTNGKHRAVLTDGREYRVKASTRKAGRGKTADLVILDELREHTNWGAWGAITKTIMAVANAMVLCISNAGDTDSVVLRHLRAKGHIEAGDPDGTAAEILESMGQPAEISDDEMDAMALGFFEWSAPPDAAIDDREAWARANPSMGYTITERALASACATDDADTFRTECMCQWITAAVKPPFPEGAWDAGRDDESVIAPDSRIWYAVDVSADRTHASIAVCGMRPDRAWHVELAEYAAGIEWVKGWFQDRAARKPMTVAVQGRGAPASGLADVLDAISGVTVAKCEGSDLTAWTGRFYDSVAASSPDAESDAVPVMHRTQPAVDFAAQIAQTKPLGDAAFAFDRKKSKADISPLIACMLAFGAATDTDKAVPSAYEERGLTML